ncbi:PREDICTED: senescence-associated carboxylesterase 101 isoform X2 [Tarenaya hassleriana]|uniref:senescence-associated carboxylesterase 101 isoform X2 n=1 Tax=Tarenaya hassleriana TaxID=28532 RepID=UPI00053C354E|nr:PREDICTED: senescence-associated carboxylesterase 101 isoform X2 [Tarenaya hassleriana]
MDPSPLSSKIAKPSFRSCSGVELGKLAVSSGLLRVSLTKILELNGSIDLNQESNLRFRITENYNDKYNVVAFVAPPICTRRYLYNGDDLVNSASILLSGSAPSNRFYFLCSAKIPSFSVHRPALQLFDSVFNELSHELQLLDSETPLIITGSALGGSVASLLTLWLLENIEPGKSGPLCITFGSPLLGDTSLQQLLENSVRNSCFLHVAVPQDPLPKLLVTRNGSQAATVFKPFGTTFFCCESGCLCIEDPDAVLELVSGINGGQISADWGIYGEILHWMERSSVFIGASEHISDWFHGEMFLQPDQMGRGVQDDLNARVIGGVIMRMEERAKKKLRFDPYKKLEHMKINMIQLEWYKKGCRSDKIGYYDHFKGYYSSVSQRIVTVEKYKKELMDYWNSMVEEAEKKPQTDVKVFKSRFLLGGNTYRRMVEPLDIAEHYRNGRKDYMATRPQHYIRLQKLFEEAIVSEKSTKTSAKKVSFDLLTLDTCFWAKVEEALIAIKELRKSEIRDDERESLTLKLLGFERYVWELIEKREVSPEIFLEKSSFMGWWREYKQTCVGNAFRSDFTDFMDDRTYLDYGTAE